MGYRHAGPRTIKLHQGRISVQAIWSLGAGQPSLRHSHHGDDKEVQDQLGNFIHPETEYSVLIYLAIGT